MRKLVYTFFVLLCSCGNGDLVFFETGLLGKWQLEATKISPGSPVREWTPVSNGEVYLFSSDNTFRRTNSSDDQSGTFAFDEEILTLRPNGNASMQRYYVNFEGNKLILGFVGCIEECSYRYRRIP